VFANAKRCSETNTGFAFWTPDFHPQLKEVLLLPLVRMKLAVALLAAFPVKWFAFRKLELQGELWPIFNFLALPAP
jgi:hypothetical protein